MSAKLTLRKRVAMEVWTEAGVKDWPESAPKPVVLVGGEDGMDHYPDLTASSGWLLDLL